MGILTGRKLAVVDQRLRHQGRGLRSGCQCDAARGKAKGEFQKVPAFHDHLLLCVGVGPQESVDARMNVR